MGKEATIKKLLNELGISKEDLASYLLNKEEESSAQYQYECSNCGHRCNFNQERKRCPKCKKHKLVEIKESSDGSPIIANNGSITQPTQQHNKQPSKEVQISSDNLPIIANNSEKVKARREPISIKNNLFVDDLSLCPNDREFTKLVKFNVSERRPQPRLSKIKCKECGKIYEIAPIHIAGHIDAPEEWKCDSCIKRRIPR